MTSGRILLWASYNPVHLVPVAYQELAEAVTEANPEKVSETGSKTSDTITDSGKKKQRPESVITVPQIPTARRGKVTRGIYRLVGYWDELTVCGEMPQ